MKHATPTTFKQLLKHQAARGRTALTLGEKRALWASYTDTPEHQTVQLLREGVPVRIAAEATRRDPSNPRGAALRICCAMLAKCQAAMGPRKFDEVTRND